ncbi:MAG: T9SS type A sorting domain-containing protein [Calditrichia bacterium]
MHPFRKIIVCVLLVLTTFGLQAIEEHKTADVPHHIERQNNNSKQIRANTIINVNNILGWLRNDGRANHTADGSAGITYPRGTANTVYQSGIVWGGFVNDPDPNKPELRVGGQTYTVGTSAGYVTQPDPGPSPSIETPIFRIRKDYQSLTSSSPEVILDAADRLQIDTSQVTTQQAQDVVDQYASDWVNWPADRGAPYYDLNGNGRWDAGIDEPGLQEADQVVWTSIHDLDESKAISLYGSPSIGLECQITSWSYKNRIDEEHTFYRRYRIINMSGYDISEMYLSLWNDPDIGSFFDDYAGSDSLLQTGFAYNSSASDTEYDNFNLPPAAVAFTLLQGPIVPSTGGQALFDFKPRNGYRNLPLTSFTYFSAGTSISDPRLADYEGTLQWFNLMRGFLPETDISNPNRYIHGAGPQIGQPTFFPLDGDPIAASGDLDGTENNPVAGDRRFAMNTGPFTLVNGDTQEVVYAYTGGINPTGDHIDAVAELKQNVAVIRANYGINPVGIERGIAPTDFTLDQNFPNPFNPTTQIRFSLEKQIRVTLDVLNPLGQKVRTLVSEKLAPGSYQQTWDALDASNNLVSSGVYFYRLTAGNQQKVRKMILLR